ncbi:Nramp family divalent metal transporter [Bacillus sp. Marseille-Q3570]|uniref:Nramp family divalent metal transporter n=1 Tax=Bacillus sp. Marseille-Q3570 TaxID=2963522 RepID=UPI0021B79E96|nr:Nramp family divalent metal transporter [Bacillus sp. Marseille-Q3570]
MKVEAGKNTPLKVKPTETGMKKWLKSLGPALITSALVLGPGSLTLSSKFGAIYGMNLLWVIVVAIGFMMLFTEMSTRIGLATNQSFITVMRNKWGKGAGIVIGIGAFLVTASFQAGNALGSGFAVSTIFGGSSAAIWIIVITIAGILLLFAKNFYKVLETLMIVLVVLMLGSFLFTLLVTKPDVGAIFSGFVPTIPSGSMPLIIAFVATSFSIVGACYQSYLVQEKGWTNINKREGIRESIIGIFLLGFISAIVMISAATVLMPQGIQISTIGEMGFALEPLYGNLATFVFMIGLFGASFSSLTGNATIGGALLSDALGFGSKLKDSKVRYFIMAVMILGSTVALIFGQMPIELIIFAQAITIVVVPFIAIALMVVANDRNIMGELKNTPLKNVIAVLGVIVLVMLAINNIYNIFIA